jgi:NitT/TauT family transport system permease protein
MILFQKTPMWVARLLFLAALLAIWQGVSVTKSIDPIFIGDPIGIAKFLYDGVFVSQLLLLHFFWTLVATLVAFALGTTAGVLAGLLFVIYPRLEKFLDPILSGLNALPRIALAPLFLLWFGLGVSSKVALGFSLTFFIVLASTIAGARAVSQDHVILSRTLGASGSQLFWEITLPGAVPTIFSGLRLGLIYALLGVIGGEIIAAQFGLGQLLAYLAGTFQINGVFGVLFVLAILGTSLTWLMTAIEMRLLRWQ